MLLSQQTTKKKKERKKRDEYINLVRELKNLWNIKVTVIPIVIGALGIIPKGLVKGLENLEIRGQVDVTAKLMITEKIVIMEKEYSQANREKIQHKQGG